MTLSLSVRDVYLSCTSTQNILLFLYSYRNRKIHIFIKCQVFIRSKAHENMLENYVTIIDLTYNLYFCTISRNIKYGIRQLLSILKNLLMGVFLVHIKLQKEKQYIFISHRKSLWKYFYSY